MKIFQKQLQTRIQFSSSAYFYNINHIHSCNWNIIGLPTGLGKTPTVNFGPGDPAQAHQPNERVSVRDLIDCTKAIALAIEQWCR
ncbi:hypothetical protein LJR231_005152 [Phyllobacterium sp. LjRoot231]